MKHVRNPTGNTEEGNGRRPYPSDVSPRQWRLIAASLPDESPRGRPRSTDLREVVNAVNYRWTTGCVWRMLPHDFPPWETVYTYFRDWQRNGTLKEVRSVCLRPNWQPHCRRQRDGTGGNGDNREQRGEDVSDGCV